MQKKSELHKDNFIHSTLKNLLVKGLKTALNSLGSDKIESIEQLDNEELKRQYQALENAKAKWLDYLKINKLHPRGEESYQLLKSLYFSIMQRDANWMILSSFVLDEYKKIRKW